MNSNDARDKYNLGGKPTHEPWGADAEPVYNTYEVKHEYTGSEQLFITVIEASAFTVDNEQRVAVFYGGYGDMLAVVYNILSVHTIPRVANI